MRPIERRTVPKRVRENRRDVRQEQRKPNLPGNWIVIGDFLGVDDPGNDPEGVNFQSPPYQNGYIYAGGAFDFPAFRHGLDGGLEWKGHLDLSGATSGDVMTTLPQIFRPFVDISFLVDLWDGVADFIIARVAIEGLSGEVRIYWPAAG